MSSNLGKLKENEMIFFFLKKKEKKVHTPGPNRVRVKTGLNVNSVYLK